MQLPQSRVLFLKNSDVILLTIMENSLQSPSGDCVYICTECFSSTTKFLLENAQMLEAHGLPKTLQAIPVAHGTSNPCERCQLKVATGYIPVVPGESGERIG